MADGLYGGKEEDSWAAPAHDLAYLLAPFGTITVDGASLAWPFFLAKPAVVEAGKAILRQRPQLLAEHSLA